MSTPPTSIQQPGPSPPYPPGFEGRKALAGVRETAAAQAVASEPRTLEEHWIPDLAVEAIRYSIRIPVPAGETRCAQCSNRFLAAGPTGFAAEQPICDLCLLEGSLPLGMLLALAAVVRAFGAVRPQEEDHLQASEELATFARLYERVAAKSGPPRTFEFPEGLEL